VKAKVCAEKSSPAFCGFLFIGVTPGIWQLTTDKPKVFATLAKIAQYSNAGKERRGERKMIYEIAEIEVKPGEEAAFEAGVQKAAPLFERAKGCKGMELQRTIEKPSKYRLVVKWETVEDHMVHFRGSDDFQEWRKLVGPYFVSAPVVEHTQVVISS
jgi:heme-degrading monooxygenase HmoA